MIITNRRITLILGNADCSAHRWERSSEAPSRTIFVQNLTTLRHALHGAVAELGQDIERVVLDGCASPIEFLELLSHLPAEFVGDVVFVTGQGSGFLSAIGRDGDRVISAFGASDLDFYLEVHGLLEQMSMTFAIPEPAGELAIVAAA